MTFCASPVNALSLRPRSFIRDDNRTDSRGLRLSFISHKIDFHKAQQNWEAGTWANKLLKGSGWKLNYSKFLEKSKTIWKNIGLHTCCGINLILFPYSLGLSVVKLIAHILNAISRLFILLFVCGTMFPGTSVNLIVNQINVIVLLVKNSYLFI